MTDKAINNTAAAGSVGDELPGASFDKSLRQGALQGLTLRASSLDVGFDQRSAQRCLAMGLPEYQRQKNMFLKI